MTTSVAETKSITIVRALGLAASTLAGDVAVHRTGPPPLSYGLQEITGGRSRAIGGNLPLAGLPQRPRTEATGETGWHYHNIDLQLSIIASGDVEVEFAEGQRQQLNTGDILVIPGGTPHNAHRNGSLGVMEFTLPGEFDTIPCPPNPRDAPVKGFVLNDSKTHEAGRDGVADYILTPLVEGIADIRLVTSGGDPIETPSKGICFTIVMKGGCEIEAEGITDRLGEWDMVIDDAKHRRARILNRSPDFRAYQYQLPA